MEVEQKREVERKWRTLELVKDLAEAEGKARSKQTASMEKEGEGEEKRDEKDAEYGGWRRGEETRSEKKERC